MHCRISGTGTQNRFAASCSLSPCSPVPPLSVVPDWGPGGRKKSVEGASERMGMNLGPASLLFERTRDYSFVAQLHL